jgi:LmbE family N-acetylglucosaminyl deacetylase
VRSAALRQYDIGAAGTIKLLQQKGAEIYYLTVTDDLMGVVDPGLSSLEAAERLKRDQDEAGKIIGVKEQFWLGYPDAGKYDVFDVRRDVLKYIRMIQPDFIFSPDPWLTYEAHRDHLQTGMATAEAILFAGLVKIASSDPQVDRAYPGHEIAGVAFYYTRDPNMITDISQTWESKIAAVRCYQAQFRPDDLDELVMALGLKSRQAAVDSGYEHGEPLKVLHPRALHCGF